MTKFLPYILILSLITCCIEIDISVPSFPDIASYFDTSSSMMQMTIAINFLGFCLSSMLYGPLSDAFGRRKIMIIGNLIMLCGAVFCTIANDIYLLLLSRLVQGFGAGTSCVIAFIMITDLYSNKKSAQLIGVMNACITIFMSIAPIAGAIINETLGWKANYYTIAVISVISWSMLYIWLPETKQHLENFDSLKVINNIKILISDKSFMYCSLIVGLTSASWMSFIACGPFLYIENYNLSTIYYSLHQGTIIIFYSLGSFYYGLINRFIGTYNCVVYGVILILLGSLSLIIVSLIYSNAPYLTSASMIISGIGEAIALPAIITHSLKIFPDISGTASSISNSIRSLSSAIFIAISSYMYYGELWTVAAIILVLGIIVSILTFLLLRLMSFDQE